ncbi:MAG: hypothetical protein LBC61_00425, partial [Candidatus Peribacteria bacterium]|nr:hypothetical protein [Candidatus Peribacteria bacterium]
PEVIISIQAFSSSRICFSIAHLQEEILSTFTTTKSGEYFSLKAGNSFKKAFLQILPNISQKISNFINY